MRKTEMEFIKDQIKQVLTLQDIVEFYLGQPNAYTKRYKCPFNLEEHNCNLEVKDKYWRCFSCNKSGDEIELVRELFGLTDYKDCLLKIAQDFGLKTQDKFDTEYEKKVKEIKAKREKQKQEQERYERLESKIYNKLLSRQRQLERIIYDNNPKDPQRLEIYALTKRPEIVIKAVQQYEFNETIVKIFCQYDLNDYESFIYGSATTPDDKIALKKQIVYDILNKKIIINAKGDIVSAYGYK